MKELNEYKSSEPLPPDECKTINQAIGKIRLSDKEHIYVYVNGKLKRRFIGTKNQVNIDDKHLVGLQFCTIVHNHLNNISFSLEDIESAIKLNVLKFYLITPNFLFTITKPKDGWPAFDKTFISVFNAGKEIAEELLNKLITKNEITPIDAEIEKMHYIWAVLFLEFYNISYTKKIYKSNDIF